MIFLARANRVLHSVGPVWLVLVATVTDNENGGASATIDRVESVAGEPGYYSDDVVVAVGGGELFGGLLHDRECLAHCETF